MELYVRILIIFFVMIPSDCEEVKKLTSIEGGSITLPDPVVETGFLQFERKSLVSIHERKILIYEKTFKDRVLWNSNTGLFTITGLRRSDSGIYTIDSKRNENSLTTAYRLSVYESVPTPAVERLNVSPQSCSLLCFVNKTEETTLSWYKDEELVNQSSSALSLLLMIDEQDYSSSYRCVAASPAEEKAHSINALIYCDGRKNAKSTSCSSWLFLIPILVFEGAVVGCIVLAEVKRWRHRKKEGKCPQPTALDGVITSGSVHRGSERGVSLDP